MTDVTNLILRHSKSSGSARLLLLAIAANLDGSGEVALSHARLQALGGGLGERTVQRAVAELEELGELARWRPDPRGVPRGQAQATRYRLPKLEEWRRIG